jgi:hypothetical protein
MQLSPELYSMCLTSWYRHSCTSSSLQKKVAEVGPPLQPTGLQPSWLWGRQQRPGRARPAGVCSCAACWLLDRRRRGADAALRLR